LKGLSFDRKQDLPSSTSRFASFLSTSFRSPLALRGVLPVRGFLSCSFFSPYSWHASHLFAPVKRDHVRTKGKAAKVKRSSRRIEQPVLFPRSSNPGREVRGSWDVGSEILSDVYKAFVMLERGWMGTAGYINKRNGCGRPKVDGREDKDETENKPKRETITKEGKKEGTKTSPDLCMSTSDVPQLSEIVSQTESTRTPPSPSSSLLHPSSPSPSRSNPN